MATINAMAITAIHSMICLKKSEGLFDDGFNSMSDTQPA